MNAVLAEHLRATFFTEYQLLREQLLGVLTDEDLAFSLGGTTMTIGALCRELGEVERSYVDSFRTFSQTFEYRHPDLAVERGVDALRAWSAELDRELEAALDEIAEEDVAAGRRIERPGQFPLTVVAQTDMYREALLIFYGKVSIYLRAQGRATGSAGSPEPVVSRA